MALENEVRGGVEHGTPRFDGTRRGAAPHRMDRACKEKLGAPRVEEPKHAVAGALPLATQGRHQRRQRGTILLVHRLRPSRQVRQLHVEIADVSCAAHEPAQERKKANDSCRKRVLVQIDRRAHSANRDAEVVERLGIEPEPCSRLVAPRRGELSANHGDCRLTDRHRSVDARGTQLERTLDGKPGEAHRVERSARRSRSERAGLRHRIDEAAQVRIRRLHRLDAHRVEDARLDPHSGHGRFFERHPHERMPVQAKEDRLDVRAHLDGANERAAADEGTEALGERDRDSAGGVERAPGREGDRLGGGRVRSQRHDHERRALLVPRLDERQSRAAQAAVRRIEIILDPAAFPFLHDLERQHRGVGVQPATNERAVGHVMPGWNHGAPPRRLYHAPPRRPDLGPPGILPSFRYEESGRSE